MSHKGKLALLIGLAAGAATGILFAPTKGKEFRKKMKKEIADGGMGEKSLWNHFKGMANEIKDVSEDAYSGSSAEKAVNKTIDTAKEKLGDKAEMIKEGAMKAKSFVKKSANVAKEVVSEVKEEIQEGLSEEEEK
jgi:gas vesicle protein